LVYLCCRLAHPRRWPASLAHWLAAAALPAALGATLGAARAVVEGCVSVVLLAVVLLLAALGVGPPRLRAATMVGRVVDDHAGGNPWVESSERRRGGATK